MLSIDEILSSTLNWVGGKRTTRGLFIYLNFNRYSKFGFNSNNFPKLNDATLLKLGI